MPRSDKSERPHTHLILVSSSLPRPCLRAEGAKQCQAGTPHIRKFLNQTRECTLVEPSATYVIILLESLHMRLVAPRNPQRTISENPLRIRDVAEHFLGRPLFRRIPKISIPLASSRKKLHRLHALRL